MSCMQLRSCREVNGSVYPAKRLAFLNAACKVISGMGKACFTFMMYLENAMSIHHIHFINVSQLSANALCLIFEFHVRYV